MKMICTYLYVQCTQGYIKNVEKTYLVHVGQCNHFSVPSLSSGSATQLCSLSADRDAAGEKNTERLYSHHCTREERSIVMPLTAQMTIAGTGQFWALALMYVLGFPTLNPNMYHITSQWGDKVKTYIGEELIDGLVRVSK